MSTSIYRKRPNPALAWTLDELSNLVGEQVLRYELLESNLLEITTESGTIFVNPVTKEEVPGHYKLSNADFDALMADLKK